MNELEPYKVSTITAISQFSQEWINLDNLFDSINPTSTGNDEGFAFIEYTSPSQQGKITHKGYHRKLTIVRRKPPSTKKFDTQATALIYLKNSKGNIVKTNIKIFRKGMVQLTGLKDEAQGHLAIAYVAQHIQRCNGEFQIVQDIRSIEPRNFKICLINSDFKTGMIICRRRLVNIITREYGTFCSYDACIYPAVKIQYFFNESYSDVNGICRCVGNCDGKGSGVGETECKKITIAVFGSGCVIITGAQNFTQLDKAYEFICNILKDHKEDIHVVNHVANDEA